MRKVYAPRMRLVSILPFVLASLTLQTIAQKPNAQQLLASARTAQQNGDLMSAIRDYRSLVELRPSLLEARLGLGSALAEHTDYDEAIEQFEAALPHTPTKQKPMVVFAIGLAYFKKQDLPKAKEHFTEALELQPGYTQAATLLGECDLLANDPTAAYAVYAPRTAMSYQDPGFAYDYGVTLIRLRKVFNGAQILQRLADTGSVGEVYQLTGAAWMVDGEFDDARRDLELAHRLDPAIPGIDLELGIARDQAGDAFAAEPFFRAALKAHPDDPTLNLYLGTALLKLHRVSDAQPLLEQALKLRPSSDLAAAVDDLHRSLAQDAGWTRPHPQTTANFDKLRADAESLQARELLTKLSLAPRKF